LIAWVLFREYDKGSSGETMLLTVLYVLTIFLCVVLHELGHALTARRYGIPTKKITLLPIGGVASLKRIPEKPKQELAVAAAGPAVNVIIALVLYFLIQPLEQYIPSQENMEQMAVITTENFWFSIFVVNILLVLFNLIPAFPMDGGRMLRALLGMRMSRTSATNVSAKTGQGLAFLFFLAGLFYNPFLVLIAIFVFFGASTENVMVQQMEFLKGYRTEDALVTQYEKLSPGASLTEISDRLLQSCDHYFVVQEEGADPTGFVRRDELFKALKDGQTDLQVKDLAHDELEPIKPETRLSRAYRRLQEYPKKLIPVKKSGEFKGFITMESVQRFMQLQSSLS
jgi:Zn-dependent protease